MSYSYEGNEAVLYTEAMRMVPGIAATRLRNAPNDAYTLYRGYLDLARELGVSPETAWSALSAAHAVWVTNLLDRLAQSIGVCHHVVIDEAVAAAQNWVDSNAG